MQQIIEVLKQDQHLARIVERYPFPKLTENKFIYKDLVRSIISQQLSVTAAATIYGRFSDVIQHKLDDPTILMEQKHENLRKAGLSNSKANYVRNVSEFFLERNLLQSNWSEYGDEELISLLCEIKGVGEWTAQMVLMFSLGRPDVFAIGDLSIRQKMSVLYMVDGETKEGKKELISLADSWRPFRTYACMYLWSWKDDIRK